MDLGGSLLAPFGLRRLGRLEGMGEYNQRAGYGGKF
jgi:hypothetical protein